MILDRRLCGDDFCATFYPQPKPDGAYGPSHRNVELTPVEGMLPNFPSNSRVLLTLLGTFLSFIRPSLLHHVRQPLPAFRSEMAALLLGVSGSMGNSTTLWGGLR